MFLSRAGCNSVSMLKPHLFLKAARFNSKLALEERFQSILDEQLAASGKSIVDAHPELLKIHEKYHYNDGKSSFSETKAQEAAKNREFANQYQRQIAYTKSDRLLRDDSVLEEPWAGTERIQDTARRMLVDSAPREKKIPRRKTLITPPQRFGDRVKSAKDGSLDYKIGRSKTPEDQEREDFRAMYKERLLGPTMFSGTNSPASTFGFVESLASARINATIDQKSGRFETPEMESVRGKPLDSRRLANSADSSFFINEILINQDCLPPWIENQQGIDREIQAFRHNLKKKLFNSIIHTLNSSLKESALANLNSVGLDLLFERASQKVQLENASYINTKIDDLNRGIRSYNLQCPSNALHKWKLVASAELLRLFKALSPTLASLIAEYFDAQMAPTPAQNENLINLAGSGGSYGYGGETLSERNNPKLQLWKLVKSIFL